MMSLNQKVVRHTHHKNGDVCSMRGPLCQTILQVQELWVSHWKSYISVATTPSIRLTIQDFWKVVLRHPCHLGATLDGSQVYSLENFVYTDFRVDLDQSNSSLGHGD